MNPFANWLHEVASDAIVINPTDINNECHSNMWSFSLSPEQLATVTHEDIATFIRAVASARSRQLRNYQPGSMLFYCWHDDMAGQLRFSLVSGSHGFLPFGCTVEVIHDLRRIIDSWLASPQNQGILWHELQPVDAPEIVGKEPVNYTLQVWVMPLPF